LFIVPKAGLKIRNPYTRQFIPQTGVEVNSHDLFWARLVNDGDVSVADETEHKDAE
jgi:hypothetical protein